MEIKDKPISMGVREWITKKVSLGNSIPENIVKSVVNHQFDSAYEALESNNSIEISGFGKFYYNVKKAEKEIVHCLSQQKLFKERVDLETTTEKERHEAQSKIDYLDGKLEWLYKKQKNGSD